MAFHTEPRFTAAFGLYLLSYLRDNQARYVSVEELTTNALRSMEKEGTNPIEGWTFKRWYEFAESLLKDYANFGFVHAEPGERPRYRNAFSNGPPEGGDGGSGREGDGAAGGGDGGSGMAEVLSNRVLFALDDEAFDAAVQRSLEVY